MKRKEKKQVNNDTIYYLHLNLKHQAVKTAKPISKMCLASNNILKTLDSDGLNRRLCFIAFNSNKIRPDLSFQTFNTILFEDIKGLVAFIIYGAQNGKWMVF